MRTIEDVLLSVQRYVGEALPEPWNVVLSLENDVPERPFVVVKKAGTVETDGGISTPTSEAAITIYAFPERTATRREAEAAEHAVAEVLWSLFSHGVGAGREERIPLWHYDPAWEVQTLVPPGPSWEVGYDGAWSDPLDERVQPLHLGDALAAVIPDLAAAGAAVLGKLGGPYHLQAWLPLELLSVRVAGDAGTEQPAERLRAYSPGPWRDPREFVAVSQVTLDGQDDPEDPVLRQAIVRFRARWGRPGRPKPQGLLLRGVKIRAAL